MDIAELRASMVMYRNDYEAVEEKKDISMATISALVCDYFSMPVDCISEKSREWKILKCRYLAMYFSKRATSHTLKDIGCYFGDRDHTTVLNAINEVCNILKDNKMESFTAAHNYMCRKLSINTAADLQEAKKQIEVKRRTSGRFKSKTGKRYERSEPLIPDAPIIKMQRPAADHTNTHWEKKYAEA